MKIKLFFANKHLFCPKSHLKYCYMPDLAPGKNKNIVFVQQETVPLPLHQGTIVSYQTYHNMQNFIKRLSLLAFLGFFMLNLQAGNPGREPFVAPPGNDCTLPAPSNLVLVYVGPDTARLSWSSVAGASAYATLLTDLNTGFQYPEIKTDTTISYNASLIQPGHKYQFEVSAVCPGGKISSKVTKIIFTPPYIIIIDIVERNATPNQRASAGVHRFPQNIPTDGYCQFNFNIYETATSNRYEFLTYPQPGGNTIAIEHHSMQGVSANLLAFPGSASNAGSKLNIVNNQNTLIAYMSAMNSDAGSGIYIWLKDGIQLYKAYACAPSAEGSNGLVAPGTTGNDAPAAALNTSDARSKELAEPSAPTTAPDFQVYPNPVADQLWVEFNLPQEAQVRMQLLDMAGRTVQGVGVAPAAFTEGTHLLGFNVSQLPSGVYTLLFQSGDQSFVRRIVK
jgi:hypothetical protein